MQNEDNIFDVENYFANHFANNKSKWWRWFATFAKKYYLKFIENEEQLLEILTYLNQKDERMSELEITKTNRIYNYLSLFQAIKINDGKEVEIFDEIMDYFQKVESTSRIENISCAVAEINIQLKHDEHSLSLDELYKIVISFYKEIEYRKVFFINVLINDSEGLEFNKNCLKNNVDFDKNF